MNLADYLSELLGQHDEVSMPGLGYFVRERINGYYNETEGKFYPPHNRVKYTPQPNDDDTLTQYVAGKKNISLATSKYFAEKFVVNLKEQAAAGSFLFADLGWFQTDNDQLIFEPNDKPVNDPALFGFEPISLSRLTKPAEQPAFTELIEEPLPVNEPEETIEVTELVEEQPIRKRQVSVLFLVCISAVILVLAIWQAFYFYPDEMGKLFGKTEVAVPVKPVSIPSADTGIKADTGNKASAVDDTTTARDSSVKVLNTGVPLIDTAGRYHVEVIIDAEKKLSIANSEIARYKKMGVDVKIAVGVHGRLIKLTAGTYLTKKEADSALTSLIKAGKISKQSYTIPILPKK